MAGPGAIFRELHRLRKQAKLLKDEIDRFPIRLKAQKNKITAREEAQRQAQDVLKHLKVTVRDKEMALKAKHELIAKKEKQKNESSGKPEVYEAVLKELALARSESQKLEDEILAGMSETDEQTAKLPEFEKAVQEAKKELAQFEQTQTARAADLKLQYDQAQAQLKEVEATLPAEHMSSYRRIVTAMGEDSMAAAQDGNCTACYTSLTSQVTANVANHNFVICRSCGRILYPLE
jgi:predicted  nucleic acid-binding Zn-ribbon protein